jgi:8-hydroxy-5-deazaflavin:NADPH oxidoreductase
VLPGDIATATIGLLGGTGDQGRGLARRLAAAGHSVVLGSREPERAVAAANELRARRTHLDIRGDSNAAAAQSASVVIVAVPYAGHRELLTALAAELAGKLVIDCVNPTLFERGKPPSMIAVPEGSAAEEAAAVLPESTVVSAFHDVSAKLLLSSKRSIATDVLVCGDDAEANEWVCELAGRIRGMRGVNVGPLQLSNTLESLTLVLIGVNKRYKARSGVRITGI